MENRTPRPLEMSPPTPVGAVASGRAGGSMGREGTGAGTGTTINQRAPLMPGTGNMSGLQGKLDFNPPPKNGRRQGNNGYGDLGAGRMSGSRNLTAGNTGYGREGRVVSRSGVEVPAPLSTSSRGLRAREVSGKVVEEGRMGREAWGVAR